MNNSVMFSSKSDEWTTPQEIFDELNSEFEFNLDPCSTDENHKTPFYITKRLDGLTQNWGGGACFAIHPIPKLGVGLKKHIARVTKTIHLSSC